MLIIIRYNLNAIRYLVLNANPKTSTKDKLENITYIRSVGKLSKTVLEGNFNLEFKTQEGENFIKLLSVEDLELRTYQKHYTT